MSVQTVCLGWHWQLYQYTRLATDVNGRRVLPLPEWLADMGRAALADAYELDDASNYQPDTALVNLYADGARLGMHQDKDEVVNVEVSPPGTSSKNNPRTKAIRPGSTTAVT